MYGLYNCAFVGGDRVLIYYNARNEQCVQMWTRSSRVNFNSENYGRTYDERTLQTPYYLIRTVFRPVRKTAKSHTPYFMLKNIFLNIVQFMR